MSTIGQAHGGVAAPSRWIVRWSALIPRAGRVLDLASGGGRHARWLAGQGFDVLAVDRDAAALATLPADIRRREADLEQGHWPLADAGCFDAIVVTNYLHRPLWPHLLGALGPGGVLLYETFAIGNETVGKPSNPAFLLRPGELLDAVRGTLRVVAYEDGWTESPKPAFVQRIAAVREVARADEPAGSPPVRYRLDASPDGPPDAPVVR